MAAGEWEEELHEGWRWKRNWCSSGDERSSLAVEQGSRWLTSCMPDEENEGRRSGVLLRICDRVFAEDLEEAKTRTE